MRGGLRHFGGVLKKCKVVARRLRSFNPTRDPKSHAQVKSWRLACGTLGATRASTTNLCPQLTPAAVRGEARLEAWIFPVCQTIATVGILPDLVVHCNIFKLLEIKRLVTT